MTTIESRLCRRPPSEALEWAARAIGDGARVTSVRRMRGGMSAAVHALSIEDARGARHRVVLRRFLRADWFAREPDLAEREARVLRLLEPCAIATPILVAVDTDGSSIDAPAVLMTRLPGRIELAPRDPEPYLRAMAEVLPRIHEIDVGSPAVMQLYQTYNDLDALEPPSWSRRPAAWQAVIALARGPQPDTPDRFIHRDFHPGNVLWSRGRLSGVVDWVNASHGAVGVDLGHCRANLVVLFGLETAERFRALHESIAGTAQHPFWDAITLIEALPGPPGKATWHDAGRRDLTTELMSARLDDYAASIAARL